MKKTLCRIVYCLLFVISTNFFVIAQTEDTQTFTSEDGAFTFDFPADWILEIVNPSYGPNAHIALTNSEDAVLSPDGILLQISLPKKYYSIEFNTSFTPVGFVAQSTQNFSQPSTIEIVTPSSDGTPQPLQFTPVPPSVSEITVNGRNAAYAYNIVQMAGMDSSSLLLVADLGEDYWVTLTATSLMGGLPILQQYEQTILQIVQTISTYP
jgi:hypothetical protein